LGIDRAKIGDILVDDNGADIYVFRVNTSYIIQGLSELTRFRKSRIEEIDIIKARKKTNNFEELSIIVSSMRVDNIVAELVSSSRNKAVEFIENERVLVNYDIISKNSKMINYGDIITIRGKGKFIIDALVRNTRGDRLVVGVRKYA
jgi:RNA-binding protein YlmH